MKGSRVSRNCIEIKKWIFIEYLVKNEFFVKREENFFEVIWKSRYACEELGFGKEVKIFLEILEIFNG